ncbi:unnamed protein product [Arabidopsis halleri]
MEIIIQSMKRCICRDHHHCLLGIIISVERLRILRHQCLLEIIIIGINSLCIKTSLEKKKKKKREIESFDFSLSRKN